MKNLITLAALFLVLCLPACAGTSDTTSGDAMAVETGIINSHCAMQPSREVAAGKVVEYQGHAIGFCCSNCMASFEGLPAERKDEILTGLLK